ncbi:MAG: cation transporter [Desulfuromonadales bacterium]|nr:cation transporter [Desulfuromonadales bacterium]
MKSALLAGVVLLGALMAAFGFGAFSSEAEPVEPAMAEFAVQGMTCGSCVGTIKDALGQLDGIENVDIVVTTGRSQVLFDPARVAAEKIAATISASGFPATLTLTLSGDEYRQLQNEESRLAEQYLARIGTRMIPREEFEQRLARSLGTLQFTGGDEAAARQQARSILWQEVRQRQILLAAAESNQVVVSPAEVELRLAELQQSTPDFTAAVEAQHGGLDAFTKRLREDLIINRNIEEHVLAGIANPLEQRRKVNQWYQELSRQTPVILYDRQLKQAAASSGSSCGGGCCSS